MAGTGRPHGELRGPTAEADGLAAWLRAFTRGWTQRDLAQRFPVGRTTWGCYLSGTKLIPEDLLVQLVETRVREPRLRARTLAKGKAMWLAAQRAANSGEIRSLPSDQRGELEKLRCQLNDGLHGQLRAERALHQANGLVQTLWTMTTWLQGQCALLTAERDRALEQTSTSALAKTQAELAEANAQLRLTRQELDRARSERAAVEEVAATARQQAEDYRKALAAFRSDMSGVRGPADSRTADQPMGADESTLLDYATTLERVVAALNDQQEELDRLRRAVDRTDESAHPIMRTLVGEVVDDEMEGGVGNGLGEDERRDDGGTRDVEELTERMTPLGIPLTRTPAARALQEALLPRIPAFIDDFEIAGRFLPDDSIGAVSGDWYDVIRLAEGRTVFVVGDVMGHGIESVAMMAQLRTAIRAYAGLDIPAHEVVNRMDMLIDEFDPTQLATLSYVEVDPANGAWRYCTAGHLPMAIRGPAGETSFADTPAGSLPLGIGAREYTSNSFSLVPGTTFVLYTDGLIERKGVDISVGMAGLAASISGTRGGDGGGAADVLERVMRTADNGRRGNGIREGVCDDIAVLCFRYAPQQREARSGGEGLSA